MHSIKDIWQSEQYRDFRKKARDLQKDHPYFKNIRCFQFCDNLSDLITYHNKMNAPDTKKLLDQFQATSKFFLKVPEFFLDRFYNIKLPSPKKVENHCSLPLQNTGTDEIDKLDSLLSLNELQIQGSFRDKSGPKRAKLIQNKFAITNKPNK